MIGVPHFDIPPQPQECAKWLTLIDLAIFGWDNGRMSEQKRNRTRILLSRTQALASTALGTSGTRSRNARAAVLSLALGVTASVSAAPTVDHSSVLTATSQAAPEKATKTHHWFEIGKATWYGGTFNGRKTANGETFDENEMTAAHRTLPLGSWIRVTNLKNHRTAVVRVTDRGPWVNNAVLDLSHAAATKLGFDGAAKVRIEPVDENGRPLTQLAQVSPEKKSNVSAQ